MVRPTGRGPWGSPGAVRVDDVPVPVPVPARVHPCTQSVCFVERQAGLSSPGPWVGFELSQ